MRATLERDGVEVSVSNSDPRSLDVYFAGRRVWSFTVRPGESDQWFPWPPALRGRLYGYADVRLEDSVTRHVLDRAKLIFDDSDLQFRLEDSDGRPLMVNKWLRLAPMLADGVGTDYRDILVEILARLRDDLLRLGYQPFAVGGTVLGPYRDGDLFPHDDDGDLAVFIDSNEPADVALQILRLERELRNLGYRVRVHSHAHLQIYPEIGPTHHSLYVDVFAAFFHEGTFNQAFYIRHPLEPSQLIPFAEIEVRGERFPVASDTESWLVASYGEEWRVPQPGWQITNQESTSRRFQAWFGAYNHHRHFWDTYAGDGEPQGDYVRSSYTGSIIKFESRTILNVGAGARPCLPSDVIIPSDTTIRALDYSDAMRAVAEQVIDSTGLNKVLVHEVNFLNYHALVSYVRTLPPEPFDVFVGFAAETQDRRRRRAVFWRLIRMSLKSGGSAVIDYIVAPEHPVDKADPRTWHLEDAWVEYECGLHGLKPEVVGDGEVIVRGEARPFHRVRVCLSEEECSLV